VWTSESFPLYYAEVNACLGMLYSKLYAENKSLNSYENAVLKFKESLRLITLERYPVKFAKINMEFGNLYINAWEHTKNEILYYNAVYCYDESLKVFTSSAIKIFYNNMTA
jgi:lactam utilization protein B